MSNMIASLLQHDSVSCSVSVPQVSKHFVDNYEYMTVQAKDAGG
jgi:hypothetical protein